MGLELKFYDTSLAASAITSPADATGGEQDPSATLTLNTVGQGDNSSSRDGRKMRMKSLQLQGGARYPGQLNQTATDLQPVVFIAVVLDTQCNGSKLNSEDVYKNISANANLAAYPVRNLEFSKRFRVLKTKTIKFPAPTIVYDGTNIEQGSATIPWSMFINLNDMEVNFKVSTSNDVANIVDNAISVIAYTSSTQTAPLLDYNARLRFTG